MDEKSADSKGRAFEKKVAHLFTLLGYTVEMDLLIGGRQVDLYLEDRRSLLANSYIVECKDQSNPVSTAQYDSFCGRLKASRREISPKIRGIIVSSVGFVREVKAQSENDDIELVTISELETSVVDFRQYAYHLIQKLESDLGLAYFVEPNLRREYLAVAQPAYTVFNEWLADTQSNQLTLLGDYGTGKTTLLKHLALTVARRYQQTAVEGGARGRVPIFVDLRDYTQAISLRQIILDLIDANSIRATSFAAFEYALQDGQLLLILDGFDEMASRGNYQVTLRNFREITRSAMGKAKIVLSCRTHYFTTEQDVKRYHRAGSSLLKSSFTSLYREIATRQNFLIAYMMEFEPDQVKQYLSNRCGDRWGDVYGFIQSTYNLTELSRRPVLLDMIVTSEPALGRGGLPVTPGLLYQAYVDIWLQLNDFSTIMDVSTKTLLLEQFAHSAMHQPGSQLHYKTIPDLIRAWRGSIDEADALEMDRELRTATFLVRNHEGYYRFSHKSFLEFFYARYLLSSLDRNDDTEWRDAFFSTEVYRFLRDLLPVTAEGVDKLLDWSSSDARSDHARANAIKCLAGQQDSRIPQALLQALSSAPSWIVRRSAATALSFYPTKAVVETLMQVASSDSCPYVRSNCLSALGRLNDPEGVAFLKRLLSGDVPSMSFEGLRRWSLYKSAKEFPDVDLVDRLIRIAPVIGDYNTLEPCLDLCRQRWTEDARRYCTELLSRTTSPKLAAKAFVLLPQSDRSMFVPRILGFIDTYSKHRIVSALILSLKGCSDQTVESYLCSLMEAASGRLVVAAFEVLCEDYPDTVRQNAKKWMTHGLPYDLRIIVAKEIVKQGGQEALEAILGMLSPKERVLTRITILKLIHDSYREVLPSVVTRLWNDDPSTACKRYALELLFDTDRQTALDLMLNQGLRDRKTGTRVAVCATLGAEKSDEATAALLNVLSSDYSKWVRIQALRSLCSPGRMISKTEILGATSSELDPDVFAVRRELIGE